MKRFNNTGHFNRDSWRARVLVARLNAKKLSPEERQLCDNLEYMFAEDMRNGIAKSLSISFV